MLPSGFLIRPCEGGSMIHIVDHVDLDVSLLFYDYRTLIIFFVFNIHSIILHIVYNLIFSFFLFKASNVPEVLRPLYESPRIIAQKMTIAVSP